MIKVIAFVLSILVHGHVFAITTYTIGVEDFDYSPIFSGHGPKNYEGYSRELLDRFAKTENIAFEYVPLPVKRFVLVSLTGKFDFSFPDNPKWNVENKKDLNITYSAPLVTFQDAIFVLPEKKGQGIDRLKTLGTLKGFSVWKFEKEIAAGKIKLESATNPEDLIIMGLKGRVDGINLSKESVHYHLKRMDRMNDLVYDPDLMPIKKSYYHVSTLKHPEIVKKINLFLKKDQKYIEKLKQKYGL